MKLVKLTLLATGLCLGLLSHAADPNNTAKRVFMLGNFSSVSVSSGIDLYLVPSTKTEALVVTSKDELDKVEIVMNGSEVKIGRKKRSKSDYTQSNADNININININHRNVKVYLSYRELRSISASNGCEVSMSNNATLKANTLQISASGGTEIKLNIAVNQLSCSLSGGTETHLSGTATSASIDISGASDIKAKNLSIKSCSISTSGASDAVLTVTEKLDAEASGVSDITYYGNPKQKDISKSDMSDIVAR